MWLDFSQASSQREEMGLSDRIQLGLRLVLRAFRSAVLNQPEADPIIQRKGTGRLEGWLSGKEDLF